MILGGGNSAAAELRSPPEGIINNANGAKSGNIKFLIPKAENAFCREHIAKLSKRATKHVASWRNSPVISPSRPVKMPASTV